MDSKLALSGDQKARITSIIAERQQKMKELAADTSGRKMKKARKAKSIMEDSDKKIQALLNDDQKKRYDQMKQETREEMHKRMQERKNGNAAQ